MEIYLIFINNIFFLSFSTSNMCFSAGDILEVGEEKRNFQRFSLFASGKCIFFPNLRGG